MGGGQVVKTERAVVPKKVYEAWFVVMDGEKRAGFDWLYWEPHTDRTAWFVRHAKFAYGGHEIDNKVEARFKLGSGGWPALTWYRFRAAGDKPREVERPPMADFMIPSYAASLVAATVAPAGGAAAAPAGEELLKLSLLHEGEAEVVAGYRLVSGGPEELEVGGERFKTTKIALERGDKGIQNTHWVDENRRIRKIDYNGPVAILSTKQIATGEAPQPS